ncbi:response regulator [Magnetococcales bacterium HHB-1]
MRILIVDDEFPNRMLLHKLLIPYGTCDMVVDGREAVEAFIMAHEDDAPYSLVCMDIMMPAMDGHQASRAIRDYEKKQKITPEKEVKLLMITALDTPKDVIKAFKGGCTDYLIKPLDKSILQTKLQAFGLL